MRAFLYVLFAGDPKSGLAHASASRVGVVHDSEIQQGFGRDKELETDYELILNLSFHPNIHHTTTEFLDDQILQLVNSIEEMTFCPLNCQTVKL
jgi:hypothetical protein